MVVGANQGMGLRPSLVASITKVQPSTELITAINEVLRAQTYLSPVIAVDLMQAYRNMAEPHRGKGRKKGTNK